MFIISINPSTQVNGKNLTEIINTQHENVKYLPGYKLPENIVACKMLVKMLSMLQGFFYGLRFINFRS